MQPIINPSIFYFISVCSNLGMSIIVLSILALITLIIVGINMLISYQDNENITLHKDILKKLLIVTVLGFTISSFIPSETTCYKMIAASMITPDNVEITKDAIVDLIRDISEASIEATKQAE